MFTGIVETQGVVKSLKPHGRVWLLEVEAQAIARSLHVGQSMSLNGTCLTVIERQGHKLFFELQQETLRCTNLGLLHVGDCVNCERALLASGRLDGHFVQGHVDGVGICQELLPQGKDRILKVQFPKKLSPFIVPKGSIAINGVSLTVVEVKNSSFTTHLIPHTLKQTNLEHLQKNDKLNLEVDILAKVLYHQLSQGNHDPRKKKIQTPLA